MTKKNQPGPDSLDAAKALVSEIKAWETKLPQLQKALEAAETALVPLKARSKKLAVAVLRNPAKQEELAEAQAETAKCTTLVETLKAQFEAAADELENAHADLDKYGKVAELAEKQASLAELTALVEKRKALAGEIDAQAAQLVAKMHEFVNLASAMFKAAEKTGAVSYVCRFWNTRLYDMQAEILRDMILPGSGRMFTSPIQTKVSELNQPLDGALSAVQSLLRDEARALQDPA